MRVMQPAGRDVRMNLAIEEWVLDRAEARGPTLFLCVNDPCVVIGKNQNPWREIDLCAAEEEGVRLARRVSGGGAVAHDAGNLNYSFVVPRDRYDTAAQFGIVVRALGALGIRAELADRTSLRVDGSKVSGNAFCLRGRVALHHGTLLIDSDLDRMRRVLAVRPADVETHAVPSVPAPVANLCAFRPGLSMDDLKRTLIESAAEVYGGGIVHESDSEADRQFLDASIRRHASWDWIFGHTPSFTLRRPLERAGRPVGRVAIRVIDGRVADIAVEPGGSDAAVDEAIAAMSGTPFGELAIDRFISETWGNHRGHDVVPNRKGT